MLKLLKNAAPLSKEQHCKTYLETGLGYDFARDMSFVPVLANEVPSLVSRYSLAFLEREGKVALVALLGLKKNENLYLNEDGSWAVSYVPALLRQYPFAALLGGESEERRGILCIAEDFVGLNTNGKGVALFDAGGNASSLVETAQKMVAESLTSGLQTEVFCKQLQTHNLLKPVGAVLKNNSGEERRISGMLAVDRASLDGISADALKELQKSGALELIYLHLASMRNLRKMASRIEKSRNHR